MPVTHRVDPERKLLVTTFEGTVTGDELLRHAQAMASEPRRESPTRELVDLTQADGGAVASKTIRDVARLFRELYRDTPSGRVAFVAPTDAGFGLARMFQHYRDQPDVEIRVFRKSDEALRWLGVEA